ncbi:MAG: hypothetical protein U0941_02250 [Planctomycetaceae bacterium]
MSQTRTRFWSCAERGNKSRYGIGVAGWQCGSGGIPAITNGSGDSMSADEPTSAARNLSLQRLIDVSPNPAQWMEFE